MVAKSQITRKQLLIAVKKAAKQVNGPLSVTKFRTITGIAPSNIYRLFPDGGWTEVKKKAGIRSSNNRHLSDEVVLRRFHRLAKELGRLPTLLVFIDRSEIPHSIVRRRFGSLLGLIRRYHAWLEQHIPDSPLLEEVRARSKPEMLAPVKRVDHLSLPADIHWRKLDGPEFGSPVNFLNLRHAPVNEMGVIYLFGALSYRLGFVVDAIHTAFPDCIAKRRVDAAYDRWQQVRIEFEYLSRSFQEHGHNPAQCDLIVCWKHNWPECPLEVLELRSVIEDIPPSF